MTQPIEVAGSRETVTEEAKLLELIRWAFDTLQEINPSNYDHDDVCRLNDASVEVILAFAQALSEPNHPEGERP